MPLLLVLAASGAWADEMQNFVNLVKVYYVPGEAKKDVPDDMSLVIDGRRLSDCLGHSFDPYQSVLAPHGDGRPLMIHLDANDGVPLTTVRQVVKKLRSGFFVGRSIVYVHLFGAAG
jgi:hypothetical protein